MELRENRHCLVFAIAFVLCLLWCAVGSIGADYDYIQENTLRLHILPNSDSSADQELKLYLRDRLLKEYGSQMVGYENFYEAEATIQEKLPEIKDFLHKELREVGSTYTVDAYFTEMEFPRRIYDNNLCLPAGTYHALRVVIGEGTGGNWWCVLYPPMCIPTEKLPEEETSRIIELSDGTVLKPKLAIAEIIGKLSHKVEDNLSEQKHDDKEHNRTDNLLTIFEGQS